MYESPVSIGPLLSGKSMRPIILWWGIVLCIITIVHEAGTEWDTISDAKPSFSMHPNGGGAPQCTMGTSRTFSLWVGSASPAMNSECSIFLYGVPGVSIFLSISATHSGILCMAWYTHEHLPCTSTSRAGWTFQYIAMYLLESSSMMSGSQKPSNLTPRLWAKWSKMVSINWALLGKGAHIKMRWGFISLRIG